MKYEFTIYTRSLNEKLPTWDCMLSGFASSHEALTWLIATYEPNADFWSGIEVKVIREAVK